jgi:hypothetical protein
VTIALNSLIGVSPPEDLKMSVPIWPKLPIEIIHEFEARGNGRGDMGALVLWAVWGVESLHFLDDLDHEHHNKLRNNPPHHPDVKDISHIRWATGTSISSLDLCAAALGKEWCASKGTRELDLRAFDPTGKFQQTPKHRASLPSPALRWVDGVLSDGRYLDVHDARNHLTHSRLIRNFFLHRPTEFKISATGKAVTARDLVILSKDLATDQVNAFLKVLDML